uniref:Uncharacterized protein n=1 Tax=Arundo donax TaxID=35708 RepID=A0A0A9H4A6_ARUDO
MGSLGREIMASVSKELGPAKIFSRWSVYNRSHILPFPSVLIPLGKQNGSRSGYHAFLVNCDYLLPHDNKGSSASSLSVHCCHIV